MSADSDPGSAPVLRVVHGDPSAEHIAVLAAVLAASAAGEAAHESRRAGEWASPVRAAGARPGPGPRGWARSAWPS